MAWYLWKRGNVPMNNFSVVYVLQGQKDLQHPSRYNFLRYFLFDFKLPFEMILKISLFTVFLNDKNKRLFFNNLVKRYDIGMFQRTHKTYLYDFLSTSCIVFGSSTLNFLAIWYFPFLSFTIDVSSYQQICTLRTVTYCFHYYVFLFKHCFWLSLLKLYSLANFCQRLQ